MAQYKDKLCIVEKEKEKLVDFKDSIASTQQNPIQRDNSSDFFVKAMLDLNLKDEEI